MLKSDIFSMSNGQYRSLSGIVDNNETYNRMFFSECPIDEYIAVGSDAQVFGALRSF